MKQEVTKDVNGKQSSKRLWATRFFTLGFGLVIIIFLFWGASLFFSKIVFELPEELIEIWTWMMGFGAAVILGTVFEIPNRERHNDSSWGHRPHKPYYKKPEEDDGEKDQKPFNYDEVD